MIVVRVFIYPGGDEERSYELATAVITNDGTGDTETGNYIAGFHKPGRGELRPSRETVKFGNVKGFPRKRRNVWHLLSRALREAGYR